MLRPVLCVIVPLAFSSCSGGNGLYPVSGKVTCNGQPADGATVFFFPHGSAKLNDPIVMGIVRQDATFELVCGSLGKGAPPGDYDVVIEWRQRPSRNNSQRIAPDKLAGRYADPKHPALHATVEAGTNELAPFELTN